MSTDTTDTGIREHAPQAEAEHTTTQAQPMELASPRGRERLPLPHRGHDGDDTPGDRGETNQPANITPKEPTLEESWEVIKNEVTSLDYMLIGGWKEDIDTLLISVRALTFGVQES
ncbi:hypothetical protein AAF712_016163 [Marasmius tenuissimus]|uniref:Uncharacterized protein n=1 Tax=Marasmius tenuissimus TaxID=585030 RepID=A0ABR2Z7F4_9AGAR